MRAVPCMVLIFHQPVFLCVAGVQLCPLGLENEAAVEGGFGAWILIYP